MLGFTTAFGAGLTADVEEGSVAGGGTNLVRF